MQPTRLRYPDRRSHGLRFTVPSSAARLVEAGGWSAGR